MATRRAITAFVVSYGEENFFLDRDLQRYKSLPNREIVLLDGSVVDGGAIVTECTTLNFDASNRAVIVDNAEEVQPSKSLDAYVEATTGTETVLVAICRSKDVPKAWAAAAEKGRKIEHDKLQTWENKNEVLRWIPEEAKDLGIKLGDDVVKKLFDFFGSDLYRIYNELKKLTLLIGAGGKAELKDLLSISQQTRGSDAFRVADNFYAKNLYGALTEFSLLSSQIGEDRASILTVAALQKLASKLAIARQALDKGAFPEEIATAIEISPWRCKSYLLPMVHKNALSGLVSSMVGLCKLDLDVKGRMRGSKRTAVELFFLSPAVNVQKGATCRS